jgi:cytochrome b6-f complex iron-sulfur subunit
MSSDPSAKPADKPATPAPAPAKPAAAKAPAKGETRRGILGYISFFFGSWFAIGWTTFGATAFLLGGATQRFMTPNVLSEPPNKIKVGYPDQFEEGKVVERYKDQNTWIVRRRDETGRSTIYALSTTCTHLGCTPNWLEREQKFKCPCHGSGFYITGINFEGPAPRPLERWAIGIGEDGQIVVDKSQKFQYERGDWTKAESYIVV